MEKYDLSVVTVTYNEKDNIPLFIEKINAVCKENQIKVEVIVVDDSSPDGTSEIVLEWKKKYPATVLIKRPGKMGIGSAYFTGFKAAQGRNIAFLDADLSHPPEALPELYRAAQEKKVVFGSRYLGNTAFETDVTHRIGTYVLNRWVRFWLRTGMNDHTNGYIVIPADILASILAYGEPKGLRPFDHILYSITIAAIVHKQHIPSQEIKATYTKRVHGETKIPFWWGLRVVLRDMLYTLKVFSKLR